MESSAPSPFHDSPSLQALRNWVESAPPDPGTWQRLLEALEEERRLEHGLGLLRQARLDPRLWSEPLAQMKAAAAKSRDRRMSQWQLDPERRTLRLAFEAKGPATELNLPALLAHLSLLLMNAGLLVAMGLEKHPRPAVHLAHPLPLGVEGWGEWADASLQQAPPVLPEALPGFINRQACGGLRILRALLVPNHGSSAAELACGARWKWDCPPSLEDAAREKVAAFLAAPAFELLKPGKGEGAKGGRATDIRPLVESLSWEGSRLTFRTRITPGVAPNPRKYLAAILGCPPETLLGLARTELELQEDPKLLRTSKYAPKLHNMFEDAVLLDSPLDVGGDEEEDDGVILLG